MTPEMTPDVLNAAAQDMIAQHEADEYTRQLESCLADASRNAMPRLKEAGYSDSEAAAMTKRVEQEIFGRVMAERAAQAEMAKRAFDSRFVPSNRSLAQVTERIESRLPSISVAPRDMTDAYPRFPSPSDFDSEVADLCLDTFSFFKKNGWSDSDAAAMVLRAMPHFAALTMVGGVFPLMPVTERPPRQPSRAVRRHPSEASKSELHPMDRAVLRDTTRRRPWLR